MKPVMETILAHWFWQYFQANRWRFVQRTQTAEPPGEDFTTWDLPRILAEIDLHFTLALCGTPALGGGSSNSTAEGGCATLLKATPIARWDDLIEKGTMPDTYRPTLYDFLVHEALSFYQSGEQAGAQPQDTFEIMADSPIFAPVEEFLAWEPETPDLQSAKVKAIRLYQSLLEFHQDDADPTAFADADLHRLVFGYNQAIGPEKTELYVAALERFVDTWESHEIAARGLYEWARTVHSQEDYLLAHTLASRGWTTYPLSVGGKLCYNLIQQIEGKSASISTERVWNDPLPEIRVTYRNVTQVYFRAVPFDDFTRTSWWSLTETERDALLAGTPALEWSAQLPPTDDYKLRTETLPSPQGLAKGFYLILASHDPAFKTNDNQLSLAPVWVSDLALVVRSVYRSRTVEGFVLDARTGEPIVGAAVTRWIMAMRIVSTSIVRRTRRSPTTTACSASTPKTARPRVF
jgi:hypothetical protein